MASLASSFGGGPSPSDSAASAETTVCAIARIPRSSSIRSSPSSLNLGGPGVSSPPLPTRIIRLWSLLGVRVLPGVSARSSSLPPLAGRSVKTPAPG